MKKTSSENSKENLMNSKLKKIEKSKTEIQSNTTREYMTMNNELNNDSKFSIDLVEEEEDELNSDEYISSTMLDVETNTYIEYSNNDEKKVINKSNTKNLRNFVKAININNNDYLNQNRKSGKSNSSNKSKNKKNGFCSYSPIYSNNKKKKKFKKRININDANEKTNTNKTNNKNKKEIIYKKLDVKDIQNKNNKNKEEQNNNKNYSLFEYNSPTINYIYERENEIKKDNNSNNNYMNIVKKKNSGNKNENKNVKLGVNKIGIKHIRYPTLNDNNINKNKYINEFLIKQKYKNANNSKFNKNKLFSPINKKIGINSLKTINTINNSEAHSSIINRLVNNINHIRINSYIANSSLSHNTRTINSNLSKKKNKLIINENINLNKNNKIINRINHIIFSPGRKTIEKSLNKNINSSYANKMTTSNSISIEKNNKNNNNKLSDRLLTYDFQDNRLLTRNRTFKTKKILNNKTKYLNLLLNKKKINLNQAKELLIASNKSPKFKIKMNLGKKSIQSLQSLQNQNKSNYHLLTNNTSSTSYRKSQGQNKVINSNINNNKTGPKNTSKKYISLKIKKDKQSNNSEKYSIISQKSNNNIKINPFNYQNYNINKINKITKRKILSLSKGKSKCQKEAIQNPINDINLTSINVAKNNINSNIIRNEKIGLKKKNKERAKTLIEDDYIRDIIIKSINQDSHMNKVLLNNNYKKDNKNLNNYISLNNFKFNTDSNYLPSDNDIFIKRPSEGHNINLNININMNNNNYKKLVYHYHGHNKSAFNFNYANTNNNTIGNINKKEKKGNNKNVIIKKKLNLL